MSIVKNKLLKASRFYSLFLFKDIYNILNILFIMKKIIISEQQNKEIHKIIKEMLDTNTNSNNNNPAGNLTIGLRGGDDDISLEKNTQNTINTVSKTPGAQNLLNNGATMDVEGTVGGKKVEANFQTTNESYIINKKQLNEIRLKKIKSNSELIKMKDFIK